MNRYLRLFTNTSISKSDHLAKHLSFFKKILLVVVIITQSHTIMYGQGKVYYNTLVATTANTLSSWTTSSAGVPATPILGIKSPTAFNLGDSFVIRSGSILLTATSGSWVVSGPNAAVSIVGTGILTTLSTATLPDVFLAGSSSTLIIGGTLNITGSLTNNGIFAPVQPVIFSGSAGTTQYIQGSASSAFYTLTVATGAIVKAIKDPSIAGTFTISGTGHYIQAGTSTTIPGLLGRTFDPTSTYEYVSPVNSNWPVVSGPLPLPAWGNVIINLAAGNNTTVTANGNFGTIAGNFIVNSTGSGSYSLFSGTATTTSINGSIQMNAGTLNINTGAAGTVTVGTDVILNAGTLNNGGTGTAFNVAGNWTNNGGTYTPNANGTINFNGTVAKNINGTVTSQSLGNITLNKSASLTVANSTTMLSIANLILNTNTFDAGTAAQINVSGDWTTASGTTFNPRNGTVTFNNTTKTQQINGTTMPQIFYNLILANTGQTLSLQAGTVTANNNLTIGNGCTLDLATMDLGNYHLIVTGNLTINGTLKLAGGSSSNPKAGDISVGGSWTRSNTGIFNYNADNPRAVSFINATSGTITASGGETFAYAYLNKTVIGAKITLADSIAIIDQLGLYEGTLDLANKNIDIVSTRYNTANIDQTLTPSNVLLPYSGTGRFVIERFFAARRAWRLITAPVNTVPPIQTINQAWQEGSVNISNTTAGIVNPLPGYGTLITGAFSSTAGETDGFDPGTEPNSSIYHYNNGIWDTLANTNATNVNAYPGYMLFVRGNRNYIIGNQNTPADTTTLHVKGEINVGPQTISSAVAGFKMVGNPYASAFDFHTATKDGVGDLFYEFDPEITVSNDIGAFVTLDWNGSYYSCAPTPISPIDSLVGRIESGSAFFVNFALSGGGSLTINESDKDAANTLLFRPVNNNTLISLRANLYAHNSDGTTSLNDGVLTLFDPSYDNAVTINDAVKLTTVAENIALKRGATLLAIELRKPAVITDSVFYNLSRLNIKNYRLQLIGSNFNLQNLSAYLEDTLLHTSTLINLNDTTNIDFNIPDAATAANSGNRFRVVFKEPAGGPLAVTYTNIEAWQQTANADNIIVRWSVANELNIKKYEVERSFDGKDFVAINAINAIGNNNNNETYSFIDNAPQQADNFYRIANLNDDGSTSYSRIVKVNIGNTNKNITIYPNPIQDGLLNLSFNNMPKGTYGLRVLSSGNQLIAIQAFEHQGGSANITIPLSNYLAGAVYNLEITTPDNNKKILTFITGGKNN